MTALLTLRKSVLDLTQFELGEEIGTSQTKVCRAESSGGFSDLSSQAFLMLADCVQAKTGIALPPEWYFRPPSDVVLLSYFSKLAASPAPVTGKGSGAFPAHDAASPEVHLAAPRPAPSGVAS